MGVRSNEIEAKRSLTTASTSARIGSTSRIGVENVTIVDLAFDEALTPLTAVDPIGGRGRDLRQRRGGQGDLEITDVF